MKWRDVRVWHETDMSQWSPYVRCWGNNRSRVSGVSGQLLTRLGHWLRPRWLPVIKVNSASFENPIFLDRVALAAPPCGSDRLRHVPPMT
jgi:hypothetical protein